MYKEIYFNHTTSDGITYQARPMPREFIESNVVQSSGTAVRVYMIDANEERKFKSIPGQIGVYISDEGEQGYVGYYDFYLESDNTFTSGMFYVHPFHRHRNLTKNLISYLVEIAEGNIVYNNLVYSDKNIARTVEELAKQSVYKLINKQSN